MVPSTPSLPASKEIKSGGPRGRPRCFDPEQALERSMVLFWEKGFQNTSLDEIAQAVGVKKPSLYAAFGDKEMLFRRVIQRYSGKTSRAMEALQQPEDICAAVGAFIDLGIASACGRETPRGCLLASAFADSVLLPDKLAAEVRALVAQVDRSIARRLKLAVNAGQLPGDFDVKGTAKFLNCLMHGIALRARAGEKAANLQSVKRVALRCLGPHSESRRRRSG